MPSRRLRAARPRHRHRALSLPRGPSPQGPRTPPAAGPELDGGTTPAASLAALRCSPAPGLGLVGVMAEAKGRVAHSLCLAPTAVDSNTATDAHSLRPSPSSPS